MFHAMVSVMAVKIQLSSPKGLFRSDNLPGILSNKSKSIPWRIKTELETNQRNAILMGHVKQEVKTSAGSSGFIGKSSFAPQAARRMKSLRGRTDVGDTEPDADESIRCFE